MIRVGSISFESLPGRMATRVYDFQSRPSPRSHFPGYGWLGSQLYFDPDIAPDEARYRMGTAMVDNSAGAKTFIKVDLSSLIVSYESTGWASMPTEPHVEWFVTEHQYGPFKVPRTG